MSLTIILKSYAAPGNVDEYPNVSAVGAQNTNTGTKATDQANFLTAAAAAVSAGGGFAIITYTDTNGVAQTRVIAVGDIKTAV